MKSDPAAFKTCDAKTVFAEVGKRVDTPELRALWQRLHDELKRTDVGAAITYLEGEFERLEQEFTREIDRARTSSHSE